MGAVYTWEILDPSNSFGTLGTWPGGYADGTAHTQYYGNSLIPDIWFKTFITPDAPPGSNIYLTQAGNIGVGTTSPTSAFDVATGDVTVSMNGRGLILRSPDGFSCRRVTIDNAGALVLVAATCQ